MRVLVTGVSGNIGTALMRRLAARDDVEVVGVARREPAALPWFRGVRWVGLDLGDLGASRLLAGELVGVDAVVHLAWAIQSSRDPARMARTNLLGTRNVVDAVLSAGVAQLVYLSSVAAYAPRTGLGLVDEGHPIGGVAGSLYSEHKAAVEQYLDQVEPTVPELALARLRPGLVLQRDAGVEIARAFLGPLHPARRLAGRVPVVPLPRDLVAQAVHSTDVADAVVRAMDAGARGPFNLDAPDLLHPADLAAALGGRAVPVPWRVLEAAVAATWRTGLQATDPGWLRLARQVPLLASTRAERELGWRADHTARQALQDLVDGMRHGSEIGPVHPLAR